MLRYAPANKLGLIIIDADATDESFCYTASAML
jgi:hypothetical protein